MLKPPPLISSFKVARWLGGFRVVFVSRLRRRERAIKEETSTLSTNLRTLYLLWRSVI